MEFGGGGGGERRDQYVLNRQKVRSLFCYPMEQGWSKMKNWGKEGKSLKMTKVSTRDDGRENAKKKLREKES